MAGGADLATTMLIGSRLDCYCCSLIIRSEPVRAVGHPTVPTYLSVRMYLLPYTAHG